MPCGVITSIIGEAGFVTSTSTSRSSSLPSRSMRRSFSRVSERRRASGRSRSRGGDGGGQEQVEQPLLGQLARARPDLLLLLLAHHRDGELGQVADDRLDVAADVADLGELRGLDLDEGRLRELGEPAGDLGLPDAGRADHDDVLRRDLVAQRLRHLLPAPAVAQRDGDGALGVALADDVAVELGDDLAGREASGIGSPRHPALR